MELFWQEWGKRGSFCHSKQEGGEETKEEVGERRELSEKSQQKRCARAPPCGSGERSETSLIKASKG